MSDTRREDVARVRARAIRTADSLDAIGDPVIEAWDGEEFTTADLRALAALPAPPAATTALRAVLDLHAFVPARPGYHPDGCRHCQSRYPCPTVTAITTALEDA